MASQGIGSRQEAEAALTSVCEGFIDCLKELQALHLTMDDSEGTPIASISELTLRLRKAHLHAQSITSWEIGRHVLHVMAPDIRAAQEQLDPIVLTGLADNDKVTRSGGGGGYTSDRDRALNLFCHPTAVSLIYGPDQGGLHTDNVRELAQLVPLLGGLVTAYCLALGMMAGALSHAAQSEIVSLLQRAGAQLGSVSYEAVRPFVEHEGGAALRQGDRGNG